MEIHEEEKHKVDESYRYPDSTEVIESPDFDSDFYLDHNFAMHTYLEHNYTYTCDHYKRHLPVEDNLFCLHIKQCHVHAVGTLTAPAPNISLCILTNIVIVWLKKPESRFR